MRKNYGVDLRYIYDVFPRYRTCQKTCLQTEIAATSLSMGPFLGPLLRSRSKLHCGSFQALRCLKWNKRNLTNEPWKQHLLINKNQFSIILQCFCKFPVVLCCHCIKGCSCFFLESLDDTSHQCWKFSKNKRIREDADFHGRISSRSQRTVRKQETLRHSMMFETKDNG